MRELVLYGLARTGAVETTERFVGLNDTQINKLARQRLDRHHAVEVWEASVCIVKLKRP